MMDQASLKRTDAIDALNVGEYPDKDQILGVCEVLRPCLLCYGPIIGWQYSAPTAIQQKMAPLGL
jgi:hypothetical protein